MSTKFGVELLIAQAVFFGHTLTDSADQNRTMTMKLYESIRVQRWW